MNLELWPRNAHKIWSEYVGDRCSADEVINFLSRYGYKIINPHLLLIMKIRCGSVIINLPVMNKIVGLVVSWGNEKWLDLVIQQALYACDEVIISIGPHSSPMKKYEDSSLQIAKSYGDKIKIVPVVGVGNHSHTKAATMNAMLAASDIYEVGNWIWLLDDDEFWHYDDIDKMKEIAFTENYDFIYTKEYFFFINMKNYLINKNDRGRFWRINSKSGFRPTNNWQGKRDKEYHYDGVMYHYSLLMNPQAKMDFWGSEYTHGQNHKVQWAHHIYLGYELDNQDKWLDKCKLDFGIRNPFPMGKGQFYGESDGKLLTYEGTHPKLIEDCDLFKIKDFRKIY